MKRKRGVSSLKWKRRLMVGATDAALFSLSQVLLVGTISYTRGTSAMVKQEVTTM